MSLLEVPMPAAPNTIIEEYRPYGGNRELFRCRAPEILLSGPAGTGKTRANLELFNLLAMTYPGARLLMLRKTRRSLTARPASAPATKNAGPETAT